MQRNRDTHLRVAASQKRHEPGPSPKPAWSISCSGSPWHLQQLEANQAQPMSIKALISHRRAFAQHSLGHLHRRMEAPGISSQPSRKPTRKPLCNGQPYMTRHRHGLRKAATITDHCGVCSTLDAGTTWHRQVLSPQPRDLEGKLRTQHARLHSLQPWESQPHGQHPIPNAPKGNPLTLHTLEEIALRHLEMTPMTLGPL